jgi:streptogramin lyase
LFLLSSFDIHAQWREYHFDVKDQKDGLTSNIIDIVQDSLGFIYLATGQGFIRYDGTEFKKYSHNPEDKSTISFGEVWSLEEGNQGKIWLGMRFDGLNSYSPKTGKFIRYGLPVQSKEEIPSVTAITEDNQGNLWVGGQNFKLYLFDKKNESFQIFSPDWKDNESLSGRLSISEILQDKNDPNILWLSILDYHYKTESKSNYVRIVRFNKITGEFTPQPCGGRMYMQDSNGVLWGGAGASGVWIYDPSSKSCTTKNFEVYDNGIKGNPLVRDILQDKEFKWIATGFSISIFNNDETFNVLLNDNDLGTVDKIFRDRSGNIWFCRSTGLHIINRKHQHIKFFSLEELGIRKRIYPGTLVYDSISESMYLANNSTNLYNIPLDKNKKPAEIELKDNVIGIALDKKGSLIFSDSNGLGRFQKNGDKNYKIGYSDSLPKAFKLSTTGDSLIAGLSSYSFFWLNQGDGFIHEIPLSNAPSQVNSFEGFNLGNDQKAILFNENLYEINLDNSNITHLKFDPNLNPNSLELNSVIQDAQEYYWIVFTNMVGKFERQQDSLILIDSYSGSNGLENSWAQRLFEDYKGRIWVYSWNGINCIDPENKEVRYFGVKDGLPSLHNDPFQIIEVSDNKLASVCGTGVIIFHPDSLWNSRSDDATPLFIKNIRIDGINISSDVAPHFINKIKVKPDQNVIDFEFLGLSYPENPRNEYYYRVAELRNEWISIGTNKFVTLPSLTSGNYTLEIRAGSDRGTSGIKSIEIEVATPFYKEGWFILLLGLILSSLAYLAFQHRIQLMRKTEEKKTIQAKKEAELELKALRSQMNPHFMFNSLNSIKNYILQNKPKIAAEYLSNFAHLIRLILQNSRERSISLQEEIETLILYIDLEKLRFDNEFDFQCAIDKGVDVNTVQIPPMILQPYIENAIWHGLMHKKSKGVLTLNILNLESKGIQCIVEDNGVGREKSMATKDGFTKKYKSMGMGITKDRIAIINKMDALGITIEIIDKYSAENQAEGTRVVVTIPSFNESY